MSDRNHYGTDGGGTGSPLDDVVDSASTYPPVPDDAPQICYHTLDEFVRDYLRRVYRRRIDGKTRIWAARWWEYEEAVIRLEVLWRSWEQLRLDPSTGISVWLRDHADYHMSVLMDPQGPFSAADASAPENQCGKGEPLPYEPPPAGMFPEGGDYWGARS